jgi:hypothetical protein
LLGTPVDSVPVNNQAQGGAVRGGTLDDGSGATATVVNTATDDRAGGDVVSSRGADSSISVAPMGVVWADPIAVVAADFAGDDVLGDLSCP